MQSFVALAAIVGAATATYHGNSTAEYTQTITETVSTLTTYCPHPTTLTQNGKTHVVTTATTLTITDCPCTKVKTIKGPAHPYTITEEETVTAYTTVCPVPTTHVEKNVTRTATEGETLTIDNCPCVHPTTKVVTPGVPVTKTEYITTSTVVSEYTTVCPVSSTIVIPGPKETVTYTFVPNVPKAITNGPFTQPTTITKTAISTPGPAPTSPAPAPVVPAPAPAQPSAGVPVAPTNPAQPFEGAGAKNVAGLSLGGLFGLLAYIL